MLIGIPLGYAAYTSKLVSLIGYIFYFFAAYILIRSLWNKHQNTNFISKLFLMWIIYLLITSIPYLLNNYKDYIYLKKFISGIFFLYLIPFLIIADLNAKFYRMFFKLSYNFLILYLVIVVPFFFYFLSPTNNSEWYVRMLVGASPILALAYPYHNRTKGNIIIIAIIFALIAMVIPGRRNMVLYLSSALFFVILINIFSNHFLVVKRRYSFIVLFIIILIFCGMLIVLNSNSFSYFIEKANTGMYSREDIIELFINDLNSSPKDWIWGRGIFGQFNGGVLGDSETGLRDGIENGYLILILKGGWIYLGLLILISFRAIYFGFFKSKNILCKGFSAIILIYYIDMIGFGVPDISLKYILIFISIGACNTKWLLESSDEYLAKEIGLR